MTNSYHLLLPSLLVCSVVYLASTQWTIFHNQVKNKVASAAHSGEFFVDILQTIRVKDLMGKVRKVTLIPQNMSFEAFRKLFSKTKQHYFPVMDPEDRLAGIFSSTDIRGLLFERGVGDLVVMQDIAHTDIIVTTPCRGFKCGSEKVYHKKYRQLARGTGR